MNNLTIEQILKFLPKKIKVGKVWATTIENGFRLTNIGLQYDIWIAHTGQSKINLCIQLYKNGGWTLADGFTKEWTFFMSLTKKWLDDTIRAIKLQDASGTHDKEYLKLTLHQLFLKLLNDQNLVPEESRFRNPVNFHPTGDELSIEEMEVAFREMETWISTGKEPSNE